VSEHIPIADLVKLAGLAALPDDEQTAHLRECEQCRIALRIFVDDWNRQRVESQRIDTERFKKIA